MNIRHCSGGFVYRSLLSSLALAALACCSIDAVAAQETTDQQNASQTQSQPAEPTPEAPQPAGAQPANSQPAVPPLPDLTIPKDASREVLEKIIATAKAARPRNPEQYRQVQTALRDASGALVKLIADKNDPVRLQAELDSLSSAAALMVNDPNQPSDQVLDRMRKHLESREELTLADVQTGIVVAFYLEMQPHKTPARDAYAMLEKRLTDDPREEMQALRATLQANVRRLETLGNKFQLDAKSIDGKAIKTEDFAGKFVIVDFFATWCAPCIEELPHLEKLHAKYRDRGLEVISISIDADRGALDTFMQSHPLAWPVIYDDAQTLEDKLQMKFGILSLPAMWLLNKEGVVISLEARGSELDRLMERIFEAPTPADAPKESDSTGAGDQAGAANEAKQPDTK